MVTHDRDLTRRMNWFDRQFLRAQDFADEQDYQLDRRHRHNRLLHTAGVADGLTVTGEKEGTTVTVAPGTAIDAGGRELVLLEGVTESLPSSLANASAAEVYLVYEEQAVEPSPDPGVTGQATRVREAARLGFRPDTESAPVPVSPTPAPSGPVPGVLLASLKLEGGKLKSEPANGVRRQAGALLQEAALPGLQLKVPQKPQADWPSLIGAAAGTIGVDGHLRLEQTQLQLGAGDTPPSRIRFDATTKLLTLAGQSGVAVQGPTSGAQDALDVNGSVKVGSSGNAVRITGAWSGFPDTGTNAAEISNDTGSYKTLMIVGNKSGDGKTRKVSVWDRLEVNGTTAMNGNTTVTGALTPSVSATPDDGGHGIQFPANPGGGAGDEAYIRYAPRSGEAMSLILGVKNDPDDRISFVQGDRERLAVFGGMAHMGTLDGKPTAAHQVVGAIGFWGHGVQHGQLSFRAGDGFELVNVSATSPALDYAQNSKPLADLAVSSLRLREPSAGAGSTISAANRLHISGDELLYVLNKNGMVVGKEWGGTGSIQAQGRIGTGDKAADSGYPSGWGGGVHTFDVYAEGSVGVGQGGAINAVMWGNGTISGKSKNFVIDHPVDPENRQLVHGALEGPELAVYYRGEARLTDGLATVELPGYFEALVRPEGRTVHLTPILDDDEPVSALAASRVKEGRFTVRAADGSPASHSFSWLVYGVRSDIDPLEVEVMKKQEPLAATAET